MSSERFWIVILAVTSFLAGGAGGTLLMLHERPESHRPFHAYEERLVDRFELDAEQTRLLRLILESYDKEIEDLQARHVRELEPDLIRIGQRCKERIRKVLPRSRLDEFDRMARGEYPPTGREPAQATE